MEEGKDHKVVDNKVQRKVRKVADNKEVGIKIHKQEHMQEHSIQNKFENSKIFFPFL
jgi:hypothetical protein